jgi:hypothetical protein
MEKPEMKTLKTALIATTMLCGATVANANLVLFDNGVGINGCVTANCRSFTDLEGTGFGDQPRILTLQTDTFEQGQTAPNASGGITFPTFPNTGAPGLTGANQAITNGTDKASTPSLFDLGWTNGSKVGIGFDSDQTGNTGITLQSLTLGLYNAGVLLGSFSLAGPNNYLQSDLAEQPGNGNDAFSFVLNALEQAQWNALVGNTNLSLLHIGLAASLGCAGTPSATCQVSNDGPDSFIAIAQPGSPAVVPLPPAIWLFGSGIAGLVVLGRRQKQAA